ncbi:hypothetical protein BLAT2472_70104 [Burkholderia latens]
MHVTSMCPFFIGRDDSKDVRGASLRAMRGDCDAWSGIATASSPARWSPWLPVGGHAG